MIRVEQLRFAYRRGPEVLRLDKFEFEQEANILVVGPSGCGKTTLLHLIAGLFCPPMDASSSPDRIWRSSRRPRGPLSRAAHRHRIAAVPPAADADGAAEPAGRTKHRRACRSTAQRRMPMLAALGVDERVDAYPHQLSVGSSSGWPSLARS